MPNPTSSPNTEHLAKKQYKYSKKYEMKETTRHQHNTLLLILSKHSIIERECGVVWCGVCGIIVWEKMSMYGRNDLLDNKTMEKEQSQNMQQLDKVVLPCPLDDTQQSWLLGSDE